jgi:hypothetical protein
LINYLKKHIPGKDRDNVYESRQEFMTIFYAFLGFPGKTKGCLSYYIVSSSLLISTQKGKIKAVLNLLWQSLMQELKPGGCRLSLPCCQLTYVSPVPSTGGRINMDKQYALYFDTQFQVTTATPTERKVAWNYLNKMKSKENTVFWSKVNSVYLHVHDPRG